MEDLEIAETLSDSISNDKTVLTGGNTLGSEQNYHVFVDSPSYTMSHGETVSTDGEGGQNYELVDNPSYTLRNSQTISTNGNTLGGGQNYEIVDNPSYSMRSNKTISTDGNTIEEEQNTYEIVPWSTMNNTEPVSTDDNTVLQIYSTIEEAAPMLPPNSSPAEKEPSSATTKTPLKVNKCAVAALSAACIGVLLAAVSITIALVNKEGNSDMEVKIAKLTRQLNTTQSQLNEILMIAGKKYFISAEIL